MQYLFTIILGHNGLMRIRNLINKTNILYLIKIIFTCVLFFIVIQKYNIINVVSEIINFNYLIVLIIVISTLSLSLINSITQHIGFKKLSLSIDIKKILNANFIAPFFTTILPSTIGTDAYLTYSFGKSDKNYSQILSNLISVRLLGLISFLFLSILLNIITNGVVLTRIFSLNFFVNIEIIFWIVIVTLFVISLIVFSNKYLSERFSKVYKYMTIIYKFDKKLLLMFLLTLMWFMVSLGSRYLIAMEAGINLNPFLIITLILTVNFILMLPLTILGIGIREISYIGLFSLFGIEPEIVLILSTADLFMSLIAVIFGGILFSIMEVKTKKKD